MKLSPPCQRLPSSGWICREATLDDLDNILVVENNAQPSPWSQRVFESEFSLERSSIWVVEAPSDLGVPVAGFLVFWSLLDEIHVLNVAVHSACRRRKLATDMLTLLAEVARLRLVTVISLEVRASNQAAQQMYEGLGYVRVGRRKNYYRDNQEDAILLALIIEEP